MSQYICLYPCNDSLTLNFCHRYRARQFAEALAKGDIREVEGDEPGHTLYASVSVAKGKKWGRVQTSGTKASRKINNETKQLLDNTIKQLKWDFEVPNTKALAIETSNQVLGETTLKKLQQAATMMNKVSKTAETLLPQLQGNTGGTARDAHSKLRNSLKDLYGHIQKLNEVNLGLNEPFKNSQQVRDDMIAAARATLDCQDACDVARALAVRPSKKK